MYYSYNLKKIEKGICVLETLPTFLGPPAKEVLHGSADGNNGRHSQGDLPGARTETRQALGGLQLRKS